MFDQHLPTPEEIVAQEILRQVEVAYYRFVSQTGQEPNTVFLSGFHMTALMRGLRLDNSRSTKGTVQTGPTVLGMPIVVADVTPSVGHMVGDNRFRALPQRRQHVAKEVCIQRSAKNVAALLRYKEEQEGPK